MRKRESLQWQRPSSSLVTVAGAAPDLHRLPCDPSRGGVSVRQHAARTATKQPLPHHRGLFKAKGVGSFGLRPQDDSKAQPFLQMSTTACTLFALLASISFSASVSGMSMIFSTPLPPMTTGTPMNRSL